MYNQEKLASVSEDIKAKLLSGDKELMKTAGLAASEYFRTEIRENGIRRQITPPTTVTRENFDTVEDTDFPVMFVEIAPKSAAPARCPSRPVRVATSSMGRKPVSSSRGS